MFLNESYNSTENFDHVHESPYELGIEGALMHVYENECNYNAIMKSVGIAEFKYYNETGRTDLFVHEAGATGGFLSKIISFFKAIKDKIVAIFKKFVAKINSFVMPDKDFVKKYKNDILKVTNRKDFEFKGYNFKETLDKIDSNVHIGDIPKGASENSSTPKTSEEVQDTIEYFRGAIVKESSMTESEYRDKLKELMYGDKDDIGEKYSGAEMIAAIEGTKDAIKKANKAKDDVNKVIDNFIKSCEDTKKKLDKNRPDGESDNISINNKIDNLNNSITIWKAYANDLVVYYGALVKALKDKNRQAKAFCVKLMGYKPKNESASYYDYDNDDIFASVNMI